MITDPRPVHATTIRTWCKSEWLFLLGFVPLLILGPTYIAAGGSIPAPIWEQLDIEVPQLLLAVENGLDSQTPQILGGAWTIEHLASPGSVLFYWALSPVAAYSTQVFLITLVAYWGCWICSELFGVRPWISALSAFCFAMLPFLGTFGLQVMGMPALIWAIARLIKNPAKGLGPSIIVVIAYALFSSLALSGLFVLIILFISDFFLFVKHHPIAPRLLLLICLMLGIYLLFNLELAAYAIGLMQRGPSHREEFSLPDDEFSLGAIWKFMRDGQRHVVSNSKYILYLMLAISGLGSVWLTHYKEPITNQEKKKGPRRGGYYENLGELPYELLFTLLAIAIIAFFFVFDRSYLFSGIRRLLPTGISGLQIDRFYVFYPFLFYFGFAIAGEILLREAHTHFSLVIGSCILIIVSLLTLKISSSDNSLVKTFKCEVFNQEFAGLTWDEYVATDLFKEIEADLSKTSGSQDSYRIATLGLYPAQALMNGFWTLDGYVNIYDLDYKHKFGEIIEEELAFDHDMSDAFYGWGNQVYLYSHEIGNINLVSKHSGIVIEDLKLNIKKLKDLGGQYLFSAVPIEDSERYGLELIKRYDTQNEYFQVFVYKIY